MQRIISKVYTQPDFLDKIAVFTKLYAFFRILSTKIGFKVLHISQYPWDTKSDKIILWDNINIDKG